MVRRNEELKRIEKEKEIWNKEKDLSKEEYVVSWTRTIDVLEKANNAFGSKKAGQCLVWTCEGNYNDEDKVACKKEVIKILKLCKKEDVLINNPAVANLIYVNRLRKREAMKEGNEMKETLPEERLPQAKETMQESSDINTTSSIVSKGKEDEIGSSAQERKIDDTTVEAVGCDESDVVRDDVNIDAEEQKEDKIVSSVKEREDADTTTTVGVCDKNIVGKIVTSAEDSNSNNTTIDTLGCNEYTVKSNKDAADIDLKSIIERGKNARRQRKYD